MRVTPYMKMMRVDHWCKNVFVLPGIIIAARLTDTPFAQFAFPLFLGLASVCLITSANYVLNEWLDANFDKFHPIKKNRPAVVTHMRALWVYMGYGILLTGGLGLALLVSFHYFLASLFFGMMGVLYNVPPCRLKEKVYLDVLAESLNNPLRLALGWLVVSASSLPPVSLMLGYWMAAAFWMGIKRYAELRFMGQGGAATRYRRSFRFYTEQNLLISSFLYGTCFYFFFSVFSIKYRVEMLVSIPFLIILFIWYFRIAQNLQSEAFPSQLSFHTKAFWGYCLFMALIVVMLLFFDLRGTGWFLKMG